MCSDSLLQPPVVNNNSILYTMSHEMVVYQITVKLESVFMMIVFKSQLLLIPSRQAYVNM